MTTFEKREEAYETEYTHAQELRFKATARRDKLLGRWAAAQIGLPADEVEAYAAALVATDISAAGDHDVFAKLRSDFDAAEIEMSDHRIRRAMDGFLVEAMDQIRAQG